MFELIIDLSLLFLYFSGFVLNTVVRNKYLEDVSFSWQEDNRNIAHVLFGAIWPIYLPFFLCWAAGVGRIKLPKVSLPKFKSTEQKVLEYAKTPEKVLAGLISSKILAYPEGLNWYTERWKSQDQKISVWFTTYAREVRAIYELTVNGIKIEGFDGKQVCDALTKAYKFQEEKRKADKEAAKQLAALEAVESILLSPESGEPLKV